MLLTEAAGKRILSQKGIRTPRGVTVASKAEFRTAVATFDGPIALKAQIQTGGRGKAGGIKFGTAPSDADEAFDSLLGAAVNGLSVENVLIEERISFERERYLGFLIDSGSIWFLLGRDGGVDVEEASATDPNSIFRLVVDPIAGPDRAAIIAGCQSLGIPFESKYAELAARLYEAFREVDALIAEINPVAELSTGELIALDARIVVDDAALYRQPHLEAVAYPSHANPHAAAVPGLRLLSDGGAVAYAGIGGGLGLTIADWFEKQGQSVNALIDLDDILASGDVTNRITKLFEYFDATPAIKAVFLNVTTCGYDLHNLTPQIFAGIEQRASVSIKPIVFHFRGNGETSVAPHFVAANRHNCKNLAEGIERTVALVGGGRAA